MAKKIHVKKSKSPKGTTNNSLKYAWISGIISLIVSLPLTAILLFKEGSSEFIVPMLLLYGTYTLSYVLFARGFILIGKKLGLPLLVTASYLFIIGGIFASILQIAIFINPPLNSLIYQLAILLLLGVLSILLGIAQLKLKKAFGGIATASGVLNIIAGVSFVTVLFAFLGLILLIPIYVLEMIILYRASKTM